jgi:hypothetical protein
MQQQVESETGLIIGRKRSLVFLFFSVASVFEKSIAWHGVWVIEMIACTFVRFHVLCRRHRDCAGVFPMDGFQCCLVGSSGFWIC